MKAKRINSIFWLLAAILLSGAVQTSCSHEPDVNPPSSLKEVLAGIDRISTITENPDTVAIRKKTEGLLDYKEQYSLSFRQDLINYGPLTVSDLI